MGSLAVAVAVGMKPDELFLCGHDLFRHPSGTTHAGSGQETRDWQNDFNTAYLANRHRNHRYSGDVKYIGAALREYRGKVYAIGSVLKQHFGKEFPSWKWFDG